MMRKAANAGEVAFLVTTSGAIFCFVSVSNG